MKKRMLSLIVITTALTMTLTANSAFAGGRHHERWKGIAIGVGAAILGSAIINSSRDYSEREPEHCTVVVTAPPRHNPNYRGHWEVRDEWIPPIYKTVWNPGHYDRRGDWVEGAWIKIVDKPGYWKEKKVWVAANASVHRRY